MALILNIETATTVCSVALAQDGVLLALRELNEGYSHSGNLTVFIEEVMKESGFALRDIDAIAVSSGPGSYTGLRIGVSTAKGLCFALDKPLISTSTLKSLAMKIRHATFVIQHSSFLCPLLDARRMEVYCSVFDENLIEVEPVSAKIIDENSFSDFLNKGKVIFFGDGAEKCKNVLSNNPNAVFVDRIFPSASSMIELSEEKFSKEEFENLALFEPFYLKDFVAGNKK